MQFKTTVALLAALSAVEANAHNRPFYKHLARRQDYYGGAPVANTTAVASSTASPSSSTPSSSSAAGYGTGASSSSLPEFTLAPTGTGYSSPSSSIPGEQLVTSTISSTQIFTVTLCASTVVNCPAKSTSLVTTVISVGTTVCPQSEIDGKKPASTPVPEPTGTESVVIATNPVSVSTHYTTAPVTLTVGTGDNKHEVTTHITKTSVETIYKTVTLTRAKSTPAGVTATSSADDSEGTSTTTISTTSTLTTTVTVHSTSASSSAPVFTSAPASDSNVGTGVAAPECPAPVTVTVKETVTVTESAAVVSTPAAVTSIPVDVISTPAAVISSTAEAAVTSSSSISYTSTTIEVVTSVIVPYPAGNNTSIGYVTDTMVTKTRTRPGYNSGAVTLPTVSSSSSEAPASTDSALSSSAPAVGYESETAAPSSSVPAVGYESATTAAPTTTSIASETPSSTPGNSYGRRFFK